MNRLCMAALRLISVFVVSIAAGAGGVAAQECGGRNLVEQLKSEHPDDYARFRAAAAEIENSGAILWQITPPDGADPSYLFGTVHVSDPRVVKLPEPAAKALDASKVVALELKEAADPTKIAAAMTTHLSQMLLPGGRTLSDMLDDATEQPEVEAALGKLGLSLGALDNLRPWVVATMLSIPTCEQARSAATEGALDTRIAKRAAETGKTLVGLETVGEQLEAFNAISLELQKGFLVDTARLYDQIDDVFETLIVLYLERDVAAMTPLMTQLTGEAADSEKMNSFNEALIARRNHRMVETARPLIDAGGAFIAVGAMHLPDREGLVALLREEGYKVEPLN